MRDYKLILQFILLFLLVSCQTNEAEDWDVAIDLKMVAEDKRVTLSWTPEKNSFQYYQVIRTVVKNGENYSTVIAEFYRDDKLIYIDKEVPYTRDVRYEVRGYFNTPSGFSSSQSSVSNVCRLFRDIDLLTIVPDDVLLHPGVDRLFFVNRQSGIITVHDYRNNTFVSHDLQSGLGFCSFNGNELIVPRTDGWVFIYDVNTMSIIDQMSVSNYPLFSCVSANGFLFSNTTSSSKPIIVTDRATKMEASSLINYGDDHKRLKIVEGSNTEIFGVSQDDVTFYTFDAAGKLLSRKYKRTWNENEKNSTNFQVYSLHKKIFSAPYGNIYDSRIYFESNLPRGLRVFSDLTLTPDNHYAVAGNKDSKALEIFDINGPYRYYQTVQLKGYPLRVFNDGWSIYVVSRISELDDYSGQEYIVENPAIF